MKLGSKQVYQRSSEYRARKGPEVKGDEEKVKMLQGSRLGLSSFIPLDISSDLFCSFSICRGYF